MKSFVKSTFHWVDAVAWALALVFFMASAILFDGDLSRSILGALGIILTMFFVGTSIEVLIEIMKNMRGIGTLTGFLTNGPEALVVIVGLIGGDVLFAASTPLGSNYMNPILLFVAALLTGRFLAIWRVGPIYFVTALVLTAVLAAVFFVLEVALYPWWIVVLLVISFALFFKRYPEDEEGEDEPISVAKMWFIPALLVMIAAGYALDPIVSYTSDHSMAPKGAIGFIVLSTLTSWPEFKSVMALLRRNLDKAAVLNIVVSNITNLWLAAAGVAAFLML